MADEDVHYSVGGDAEGLKGALEQGRVAFEAIADSIHGLITPTEGALLAFDALFVAVGIGVAVAYDKLHEITEQTMEWEVGLGRLAARMQDSAENMSVLAQVADRTGASSEQLSNTTLRLTMALEDGGARGDRTREAITKLGLSFDELAKQTPSERLFSLVGAMQNSSDAASVASDIFGRKFAGTLLELSERNIPDMVDRIKDIGDVTNSTSVEVARQWEEAQKDVEAVFSAIEHHIGDLLMPAFSGIATIVADTLTQAWHDLRDASTPLGDAFDYLRREILGFADGADTTASFLNAFKNVMLTLIDPVGTAVIGFFGRLVQDMLSVKLMFLEANQAISNSQIALLEGIQLVLKGFSYLPGAAAAGINESIATLDSAMTNIEGQVGRYDTQITTTKDSIAKWDTETQLMQFALGEFTDSVRFSTDETEQNTGAQDRNHAGLSRGVDRHKAAKEAIDDYTKSIDDLTKKVGDEAAFIRVDALIDAYDQLGGAANMSTESQKKLADEWAKIRPQINVDAAPALEALYQMYVGLEIRQKDEEAATVAFSRTFTQAWKDMAFTAAANGGTVSDQVKASTERLLQLDQELTRMSMTQHERAIADLEDQRAIDLQEVSDLDENAAAKRAIINEYYDKKEQRAITDNDKTKEDFGQELTDAREHYETVTAVDGEYTQAVIDNARKRLIAAQDAFGGPGMLADIAVFSNAIQNAFSSVGRVSSGTFKQVAADIGLGFSAAKQMAEAIKLTSDLMDTSNPNSGFSVANLASLAAGWVGVAVAVASVVMSIIQAHKAAQEAKDALNFSKDLAKDFQTATFFSDSLTKAITDTTKALAEMGPTGNSIIAQLQQQMSALGAFSTDQMKRMVVEGLNLSAMIKELGGISALTGQQIADVQVRLQVLLQMAENGGTLGVKAMGQLDDVLTQIGTNAVKNGGMVDQFFLDMIAKAKASGIELTNLQKFLNDQALSAMTGLSAFLTHATVASNDNAHAMGAAVAAVFGQLTAGGMSIADALDKLKDPISQLQAQLSKAGFDGGAAFNQIAAFAALATDKVAGPALAAVSGLNQMLLGLHNSGLENEDMFAGLTNQIGVTFADLVRQGKDGNQILVLMQPTLQTMWEQEQKFGYTTDEATQALIDQGVQAGIVGKEHQSAQQIMQDALTRTADAITYIAQLFGFTVPNAVSQAGAAVAGTFGGIQANLNGPTAGAVVNLAGQVNTTLVGSFNNFGAVGSTQAANVAGALNNSVAGAVGNVQFKLNTTPWQRWAGDAAAAVRDVEGNVDALSFGRSPTGFAGLMQQMRAAGDMMAGVGGDMVRSLRGVDDQATNTMRGINGQTLAASLATTITQGYGPGAAAGAALATATPPRPLQLVAQSPIFLNEQTMRQFADIMMQKTAQSLTRDMTFELQP